MSSMVKTKYNVLCSGSVGVWILDANSGWGVSVIWQLEGEVINGVGDNGLVALEVKGDHFNYSDIQVRKECWVAK